MNFQTILSKKLICVNLTFVIQLVVNTRMLKK